MFCIGMPRIVMARVSWVACLLYLLVLIFTPSVNGPSGEKTFRRPNSKNKCSSQFGKAFVLRASESGRSMLILHGSQAICTIHQKGNVSLRGFWRMKALSFKADRFQEGNCGGSGESMHLCCLLLV